jgi:hypothetical protein
VLSTAQGSSVGSAREQARLLPVSLSAGLDATGLRSPGPLAAAARWRNVARACASCLRCRPPRSRVVPLALRSPRLVVLNWGPRWVARRHASRPSRARRDTSDWIGGLRPWRRTVHASDPAWRRRLHEAAEEPSAAQLAAPSRADDDRRCGSGLARSHQGRRGRHRASRLPGNGQRASTLTDRSRGWQRRRHRDSAMQKNADHHPAASARNESSRWGPSFRSHRRRVERAKAPAHLLAACTVASPATAGHVNGIHLARYKDPLT